MLDWLNHTVTGEPVIIWMQVFAHEQQAFPII
jgi:hypothetical protein